jgi:hypothetical protein
MTFWAVWLLGGSSKIKNPYNWYQTPSRHDPVVKGKIEGLVMPKKRCETPAQLAVSTKGRTIRDPNRYGDV